MAIERYKEPTTPEPPEKTEDPSPAEQVIAVVEGVSEKLKGPEAERDRRLLQAFVERMGHRVGYVEQRIRNDKRERQRYERFIVPISSIQKPEEDGGGAKSASFDPRLIEVSYPISWENEESLETLDDIYPEDDPQKPSGTFVDVERRDMEEDRYEREVREYEREIDSRKKRKRRIQQEGLIENLSEKAKYALLEALIEKEEAGTSAGFQENIAFVHGGDSGTAAGTALDVYEGKLQSRRGPDIPYKREEVRRYSSRDGVKMDFRTTIPGVELRVNCIYKEGSGGRHLGDAVSAEELWTLQLKGEDFERTPDPETSDSIEDTL